MLLKLCKPHSRSGPLARALPYIIIFLWLCFVIFGLSGDSTIDRRPKAYIHIGAMKTGSTDIQVHLNDYIDELKRENFCLPDFGYRESTLSHFEATYQSKLEDELLGLTNTTIFNTFLHDSATSGCNIVLSAEILQDIGAGDKMALINLKQWLAAFDVTIIAFYRDVLARLLSFYNMMMNWRSHWFTGNVLPISVVVFIQEHFATERIMTLKRLTKDYINVFGSEHFVLVDYYGVKAGMSFIHSSKCINLFDEHVCFK